MENWTNDSIMDTMARHLLSGHREMRMGFQGFEPNPVLRSKILQDQNARKRFKRFLDSRTGSYLSHILENGSIHGVKYILNKNIHAFERTFWLLLDFVGILGCIFITFQVYNRYKTSPTVISIERDYLNWNTTFPAITFCLDGVRNDTLDEIIRTNFPSTKDPESLKDFLSTLYSLNLNSIPEAQLKNHKDVPPEEYLEVLMKMWPSLEADFLLSGSLNVFPFMQTIGEVGLCFTWFSNIASHTTPKNWLGLNKSIESYNFSISPPDGDMFASVGGFNEGYTVYFHSPNEIALATDRKVVVEPWSFRNFDLRSFTIYCTEDVKKLTFEQRQCRYRDENPLQRSPIYTYNLCLMECRANLIVEFCGCLPHFYRKLSHERICSLSQLSCVGKLRELFLSLNKIKNCKCLPNCNSDYYFVYGTEISIWDRETYFSYGIRYYPRLRYKKGIIFGMTDVLTNVGGTLGLILGCSVLSLIEIFYFATLRLYWYTNG